MDLRKLRFLERFPVFYFDEEDGSFYECCYDNLPKIYTIKENDVINYVIQRSSPDVGEKEFVRLNSGFYQAGDIGFRYNYKIAQGERYLNILSGYEYLGDYQSSYADDDDECMYYCDDDYIHVYRKGNNYKLIFSNGWVRNLSRGHYHIYGSYYNSMYTFVDDDDYIQERYMNI